MEPSPALCQQDEGSTGSSYTLHVTASIQLKFTLPVFSRKCNTTTPTHSRQLSYINTGTDFGSNLVNLLSALCQMPSCRNSCGATRVLAAPVSGLHRLCIMAQPKQSSILCSLQPRHCGHTADAPHHIRTSHWSTAELLPQLNATLCYVPAEKGLQ